MREETIVFEASELAAVFKEAAASRRSRFSEKESLRGVFGESARAAAMTLVCPHRSLPNQPVQTTRLSGAVLLTRPLRSTRDRFSKDLPRARQRGSDL